MTSIIAALGIDAGQTGIKVRMHRPGEAPRDRIMPGIRTSEPLLPQLSAVVHAVAGEVGNQFETVSAGVSGLTNRESEADELLALLGDIGTRRVTLAHDSVTAFLGARGDEHGAVVAAGTGVVTLAVGSLGVARVDGWGHVMGDAGSGYWIGRRGLEAAMRAYDGRGSPTGLLDIARDLWPDVESAYIDLQTDPRRVSVIASFAEHVARLSATDEVASRIAQSAAEELAASAITALLRAGETSDPFVATTGGVFGSRIIRERFTRLVTDALPAAHVVTPEGDGLDGADWLAKLHDAHPLRELMSTSTR